MTAYLALLRGINVGGKNIIRMADLREEVSRAGFGEVRTYIQSGNVLFNSGLTAAAVEKKLSAALSARFGYEAKVMVRSAAELAAAVRHFPARFGDPAWKHNVIFLGRAADSPRILELCPAKPGIEENSYYKGTLYWSAKLSALTRSNMIKLSSLKEYSEMTVRNVNTTRKLHELLS